MSTVDITTKTGLVEVLKIAAVAAVLAVLAAIPAAAAIVALGVPRPVGTVLALAIGAAVLYRVFRPRQDRDDEQDGGEV